MYQEWKRGREGWDEQTVKLEGSATTRGNPKVTRLVYNRFQEGNSSQLVVVVNKVEKCVNC